MGFQFHISQVESNNDINENGNGDGNGNGYDDDDADAVDDDVDDDVVAAAAAIDDDVDYKHFKFYRTTVWERKRFCVLYMNDISSCFRIYEKIISNAMRCKYCNV